MIKVVPTLLFIITMVKNELRYSKSELKLVGVRENTKLEFLSLHLDTGSRVKIIGLGIRKHPRPYQRSREGKTLFQRIQTLMTIAPRQSKTNHESVPNLDNIITIGTNQPLNRSVSYNAGLINCRSVLNTIYISVLWLKLG